MTSLELVMGALNRIESTLDRLTRIEPEMQPSARTSLDLPWRAVEVQNGYWAIRALVDTPKEYTLIRSCLNQVQARAIEAASLGMEESNG